MSTDTRRAVLGYWLTSDEPDAVKWREAAPAGDWAAALKEYRELVASAFGVAPDFVFVNGAEQAAADAEQERQEAAARLGVDARYIPKD